MPREGEDCLETSNRDGRAVGTMTNPAGVWHCQDVEVDQTGHLLDVADACYSVVGGKVRTGSV